VIIYSDPMDDGYFRGDKYPRGPFRPDPGVQRGPLGFMFKYPGDPTTPGIASTMELPASKRMPLEQSPALSKIPTTPISYADARPLLENLIGPESLFLLRRVVVKKDLLAAVVYKSEPGHAIEHINAHVDVVA